MQSLLVLLAVAVLGALAYVHVRRGATSPTARDVDGVSAMFVFVKIPESIMPVERGRKYEDPLDQALKHAALGEVTGAGSQLGTPNADGSPRIAWVGIDVELVDVDRGVPFLKDALRRLGAPSGTSLELEVDGRPMTETL